MAPTHFNVVIVGGGAGGITVASELKSHDGAAALKIAIIEPSDKHYYQPAFTLVGAGAYSLARTRKSEAKLIPSDVAWIQAAATGFAPESNLVRLSNGESVSYDYLVLCPGLQLNWGAVKGLKEAVNSNGVCSNYSPDTVEYTWTCLKSLRSGAKAVFTQPPLPF